MLQFLLRKTLRVAMVLVGVTLFAFLLMHAIPGNPWDNFTGRQRRRANSARTASCSRC